MTHQTAAEHPRPAALRDDLPILFAVLFAAVIGRLPALGAWWTLDDWGLLARAAGLLPADGGLPARWLGQHGWWSLTWPLLGLDADAHAVARIALHALSALLVTRLAARAGLPPVGRLLAGLVFAGTPLAFTPLYWAAGVQELLAATCALGAVLAFTGPGRGRLLLAGVLAIASMTAKEVGLGLPLLLAGLLAFGDEDARHRAERPLAWTLVLFLAFVAVAEARLVLTHFGPGSDTSYRLGGLVNVLGNLGLFGFWMISPGPVFASNITIPMAGAGGALFVLWISWATGAWRGGRRLPAAALAGALITLAPALPLMHHIKPYMAYAAVAGAALAVGSLVPRNLGLRPAVLAAAAVLVTLGSFAGMRARMTNRDDTGMPADPVVRATALSWQTTRMLADLPRFGPDGGIRQVLLLQVPVGPEAVRQAAELGEDFTFHTEVREAVGGAWGPRLATADSLSVRWVNGLFGAPAGAVVLVEAGDGFNMWGTTANALLYAAATDIALGHFERARRHMLRAAALGDESIAFMYDPGQMIVPVGLVLRQKEAFVDWTVANLNDGMTAHEVGGLQDLYFNLLSRITGRPVAELTEGSRPLGANRGPQVPQEDR